MLVAAVLGFVAYPTWPTYDSMSALVWARDIADGERPAFDGYRTPTEHPLLNAIGIVLVPLGDAGPRVFVLLCILGLVALVAGAWRLGGRVAGLVGGVLAAAFVLTRLKFPYLAAIGFLDVPYCALVVWALVLEVERPRRGGPVWLLLALAGLLRPEAWLLALLYAAHMSRGAGTARAARGVAAALVAPVVWTLSDLAVTGDPFFSARHTDALATELERERPLHRLPWVMTKLLEEILKPPVLACAAIGAGAAVAMRSRLSATQRRALALCAALTAAGCASYLVIAVGGLATVYRYLLVASIGLIVLGAFGLGGWSSLPAGPLRRAWSASALVALLAGGVWTATHLHPSAIVEDLERRAAIRDNLVALLRHPAVTAARRCGPLSVPNHKLLPDVRWTLRLPDHGVVPRSRRAVPAAPLGVAIVIDRRVERRAELNVFEVPTDDRRIQTPPPGFRPIAGNPHFVAWARCPGWTPRPRERPA